MTPRPICCLDSARSGGQLVTFNRTHYRAYAHSSYVYCMLLVQAVHQHDIGNELLVTGGGDGTVKTWSLDKLESTGLVVNHKFKNASTSVLSLTHNGTFLYAGLADGRVQVYNLDSQQLVQKINILSEEVTTLQVVGGVAFCGTSNGLLKVCGGAVPLKCCKHRC